MKLYKWKRIKNIHSKIEIKTGINIINNKNKKLIDFQNERSTFHITKTETI